CKAFTFFDIKKNHTIEKNVHPPCGPHRAAGLPASAPASATQRHRQRDLRLHVANKYWLITEYP
ncbi:Protein of unknown function, partial [Gryllus bimaculatus]